ncbi:MAG: sarcosine oxidase subunit gamma [Ruegeria sp.]
MAYDAAIDRLPISALFDLKGNREALAEWTKGTLPAFPEHPNSLSRTDGRTLCFIGPDHWVLRADIEDEAALEAALKPTQSPPEISLVTVSDTLTFFRITGPDADQVMSIGCPLDLHISTFGPDAVSFTEFFGLKALVMRCEGGFDCGVEQSFGDMIADYLARAMA